MPSHPSPSLAARLTAASERPPTISGIGGDGGGAMSASWSEKNSPLKLTGVAFAQAAQDLQAFVHPPSACLGVDAADLDLVRVLAADPDTEREPTGCQLRDGGELTGDRHRVAQRQQVEPDVHRQVSLSGEHGGGGDQPVRPRSDEEADVIGDTEVIDARVGDPWRASPAGAPIRRWVVRRLAGRARRGR